MMIEVKDVIKDVELKPFEEFCELPAYVYINKIEKHKLVATVLGGYKVTLAKLIVGTSMSGVNPLVHVLFKSYDSHGNKMCEVKTRFRNNGDERKLMAVKSAMIKAGIKFKNIASCHILDLLDGLGAYYQAYNHEIRNWLLCHKDVIDGLLRMS